MASTETLWYSPQYLWLSFAKLRRTRLSSTKTNSMICSVTASTAGHRSDFYRQSHKAEAAAYWLSVVDAIRTDNRILIVAFFEGKIAGAVQLALESRANGNHRAEVMKLMVHNRARRNGIGEALMRRVEEVARRRGRSLIVLDTRSGCQDAAEKLYDKLGYRKAGIIPRYARSACGTLHDTVFMYRELE